MVGDGASGQVTWVLWINTGIIANTVYRSKSKLIFFVFVMMTVHTILLVVLKDTNHQRTVQLKCLED